MPQILDDCVKKVMEKGHDEKSAWAICRTSLGMSQDKTSMIEVMKHADDMCEKIKSGTLTFSEPETFDIKGVEIFAVGKWNGDNYTEKDLQDIVASFNKLKNKIKPYLKIGHGEEQKLLRDDELPSAGWISNLKMEGQKLVADFVRIPKKIYEIMRRGAYSRVSSELWWDLPVEGQTYRRVLKAVAILGGETPAVHDLNDILELYSFDGVEALTFTTASEIHTYEVAITALETEDTMELEKLQASLSEANVKLAEATKVNEELIEQVASAESEVKKLSDENAEMKKLVSDIRIEKHMAEINASLDKLIADKKIVPAQKDFLRTLLSELPETKEKKYKLGEKEYAGLEQVVMAFIEAHTDAPSTDTQTDTGDLNSDLTDKAKKYAVENKVSFTEALVRLTRREA